MIMGNIQYIYFFSRIKMGSLVSGEKNCQTCRSQVGGGREKDLPLTDLRDALISSNI